MVLYHGPIDFAAPPRAVVDAAQRIVREQRQLALGSGSAQLIADVRAVVAAAIQQRACPLAMLATEVDGLPLLDTALVRRVLAEVSEGIRSAPEGDLMDLVKVAGLPVPMFNPRLYLGDEFLAQPDAWWREAGVAGEVDSREWHLQPADCEHTMSRHDRMTAAGIRVLHFSPNQLRSRPHEVIELIRSAISAGSPVPAIREVPLTE
jgi:hypothetical protein